MASRWRQDARPIFSSANNAFYADYAGNGYPSGSGWTTGENTETVANWAGTTKTTSSLNVLSQNVDNGYTYGGVGVTSSRIIVQVSPAAAGGYRRRILIVD